MQKTKIESGKAVARERAPGHFGPRKRSSRGLLKDPIHAVRTRINCFCVCCRTYTAYTARQSWGMDTATKNVSSTLGPSINRYSLEPKDASVMASLREAYAPQKGKFMGTAARAPFEGMKKSIVGASDVTFEQGTVGGIPGWWCRPRYARSDATLIYYHGGWYMLGSAASFCNQASHFASLTRVPTFIPEYRLAPEAPFPAAFDDAISVYAGLAGQTDHKLAVVGDSVGGSLSLLVLAAAAGGRFAGTRPCGGVVMSPVTDLTLSGASMKTRAEADPLFTHDMAAEFVRAYMKEADLRDPRASPLFGRFEGLPPIRIDVGEDEILLDDAVRYAEMASTAGVQISLGIWEGMPHTFPGLIGKVEAAKLATEIEARFLSDCLT